MKRKVKQVNNLVADTVENSRREEGGEEHIDIDRDEEEDQEAHFEKENSFKEYTDSAIPKGGRKKGMRK